MRFAKLLALAPVLFCSFIFWAATSSAKPEYAKKEGKACTYCHVKAGSKELNDTGKCYQKNNHSLEGCPKP